MADTISYSETGKGWNSRHSFEPDWMIGLNSNLYTWENGEIYKHHDNTVMNSYYGTTYDSTITPIFNQEPTEQKMFKTICLEGDSRWKAEVTTDSSEGIIETDYYQEKEGDFFAYIRREADTIDPRAMSTQGIGEVAAYSSGLTTFTGLDEMPRISVGDKLYLTSDGVNFNLVETITAYGSSTITVTTPVTTTPVPGNYAVVVKDSTAESFGARG
jgi:hypothetical protein